MKERIIICIVLLVLSYAVCGCKEKPVEISGEYGEVYLWCQPCQKTLYGTYIINEGYWFECSTCQTIYANAQWEKVGNQKYKEMFGVDLIAGQADELRLVKELAEIDEAIKLVDLYDPKVTEEVKLGIIQGSFTVEHFDTTTAEPMVLQVTEEKAVWITEKEWEHK